MTAGEEVMRNLRREFPDNIIPFINKVRNVVTLGQITYRISGIFRVGLIFAEFATSMNSPKIDTVKNKPCYTSSLRVIEIAKIRLSEKLTYLLSVVFAKISRREKFPIYGMHYYLSKICCFNVM